MSVCFVLTKLLSLSDQPLKPGVNARPRKQSRELPTFDSVTTSEGVGRTKPDRRMFETALRKASATPSQSLMVGDRYEHDIVGAADAGMRTAAYGAESGPAVDFRVDDLTDVLAIVDGDYDAVS